MVVKVIKKKRIQLSQKHHIIYNKSWAQTPWLRQVASPNCRNFNKFLDFKNRYIHIFWINMTNQIMKESSI